MDRIPIFNPIFQPTLPSPCPLHLVLLPPYRRPRHYHCLVGRTFQCNCCSPHPLFAICSFFPHLGLNISFTNRYHFPSPNLPRSSFQQNVDPHQHQRFFTSSCRSREPLPQGLPFGREQEARCRACCKDKVAQGLGQGQKRVQRSYPQAQDGLRYLPTTKGEFSSQHNFCFHCIACKDPEG